METEGVEAGRAKASPDWQLRKVRNLNAQEHEPLSVATRASNFLVVAVALAVCLSCTSVSHTRTTAPVNSTPNYVQKNGGMSQAAPNEVSTDVEALSKLVTLPVRPVSAVWHRQIRGAADSRIPGPTDWYLEALLTFDQDDAERLKDEAKKSEKPRDIGSIESIDWLPSEVRPNFETEPNSSKYRVKGEAYAADAFAKSPLLNGYLIRLGESSQFFLKLYTQ